MSELCLYGHIKNDWKGYTMDLNKIKAYRGNPLMMGATVIGDTVNFAITARLGSKCELVLYEKGKNNEAARIPFENAQVIGNVFAMSIEGLDYKKYDYNFSIDGKIVTDAYAKALSGKEKWGIVPTDIRGSIVSSEFDWQNDAPLRRPYDETIIYRLHVRGFTKHVSSKAKHKGTYLGIVDKIPYLKELGITMIELMPAYEFNEMESHVATSMKGQFSIENPVLNYWGYTSGYAFAPKASYAYATKPGSEVEEFKYMVRELHRNGIEVSMEYFFPEGTNPTLILDALHYWVMEYHIDGIHANCEKAVMKMIQTDNLLSTTKIFTYNFATDTDFYANVENKNLANFNDDFMVSARKFIKGDEDMLNTISYKIKANPPAVAAVNYVANHNTFTLYDAVSYDKKYNQANGEKTGPRFGRSIIRKLTPADKVVFRRVLFYNKLTNDSGSREDSIVMIGLKSGTVKLVQHQEEWHENAENVISVLKQLLGDTALDIQHVGSTAICSIHAKPIIDIAVAVHDIKDILPYIEVLKQHNIFFHEGAVAGEVFFVMEDGDIRTHHIHIVKRNGTGWSNYISFRDYLNANPEKAMMYDEFKRKSAVRFADDRKRYTASKQEIIGQLLSEASM